MLKFQMHISEEETQKCTFTSYFKSKVGMTILKERLFINNGKI